LTDTAIDRQCHKKSIRASTLIEFDALSQRKIAVEEIGKLQLQAQIGFEFPTVSVFVFFSPTKRKRDDYDYLNCKIDTKDSKRQAYTQTTASASLNRITFQRK
jgi:hypothetical protein